MPAMRSLACMALVTMRHSASIGKAAATAPLRSRLVKALTASLLAATEPSSLPCGRWWSARGLQRLQRGAFDRLVVCRHIAIHPALVLGLLLIQRPFQIQHQGVMDRDVPAYNKAIE